MPTLTYKTCPRCGELTEKEMVRCATCRYEFEPANDSVSTQKPDHQKRYWWKFGRKH